MSEKSEQPGNQPPTGEDDELATLARKVADRAETDFLKEAKKTESQRREEIEKALIDEKNEEVKKGRESGEKLYNAVLGKGGARELKAILDELGVSYREEDLGKGGASNFSELIKILAENRRILFNKITTLLSADRITEEEGRKRQEGQRKLIQLKAALLTLSLRQAENLNISQEERVKGAMVALEAADVNLAFSEPRWFTEPLAEALRGADLNNDAVRETIIYYGSSFGLSHFLYEYQDGKADPNTPTTGAKEIARITFLALGKDKEIKEERERAKEEEEYKRRMEEGWRGLLEESVKNGREGLRKFLNEEGFVNPSASDRIIDYIVTQEMGKGKRNPQNPLGLLEIFQAVVNNPETLELYMTEFTAPGERKIGVYQDFGGKDSYTYGKEEKTAEWQQFVRDYLLTKIQGYALGIIEETVDKTWEEFFRRMSEEQSLYLSRAMEIIGIGNALAFLEGENLSFPQRLLRNELVDFLKKSFPEDEKRKGIMLKLLKAAEKADSNINERRAQEQRAKEEQREKARKNIQEIGTSLGRLEEEINNLKMLLAKSKRLREIEETMEVTAFIDLDKKNCAVTINDKRRKELADQKSQIESQLKDESLSPEERQNLRAQKAGIEAEEAFLNGIEALINQILSGEGSKTEVRQGLFGKKELFSRTYFNGKVSTLPFPPSLYETRRRLNQDADEAIKAIEEGDKATPGRLNQIREVVTSWLQTEDPLSIDSEERSKVEKAIEERLRKAQEFLNLHRQDINKIIEALTYDFFTGKLSDYLQREGMFQ